jgi:pimeloyl-ACP methyl ester carboxylesterase
MTSPRCVVLCVGFALVGASVSSAQQPDSGAAPPDTAVARADTVPPPGVTETPYTFQSGDLTLSGTLALPKGAGPFPVALIVAGSGPTDRNGNAAAGLRTNMYAQLAWGLAQHGIASLRYDKRVLPATKGTLDLTSLTFDDFAGDLAAGARALRVDRRFTKVIVIGHSEGADLAIRAVRNGLEVNGIVLVSGAGRPLTTILHEQIGRQVDSVTLVKFDSALARYLRGEPTGDVPGALLPLLAPVNQRFMQSWAAFDPVAEFAETAVPALIIQGQTDLQIRVADADALHAARPDAREVVLGETNHVLKHVADTTLVAQLSTYRDPTIPIVPQVVDAIVAWVGTLR